MPLLKKKTHLLLKRILQLSGPLPPELTPNAALPLTHWGL
jgi:hypothetical protein